MTTTSKIVELLEAVLMDFRVYNHLEWQCEDQDGVDSEYQRYCDLVC